MCLQHGLQRARKAPRAGSGQRAPLADRCGGGPGAWQSGEELAGCSDACRIATSGGRVCMAPWEGRRIVVVGAEGVATPASVNPRRQRKEAGGLAEAAAEEGRQRVGEG